MFEAETATKNGRVIALFTALFVYLFSASLCHALQNSIRITETNGTATANYPLQIARPFIKGEISNYPQIIYNGTPLITQADIKCRWDDSSVKHAVLTCYLPLVAAHSTNTLTFRNQISGQNSSYLTRSDMLQSAYNFDATIRTTAERTNYVSARSILAADYFTYWLRGSRATSIILADHSTNRLYDFGNDDYRSVRPVFHVTFWPLITNVHVRFIGENANTEVLQDQFYAFTLRTGNGSPSLAYSYTGLMHRARSRWTKSFWIGNAPPKLNIDHNVAYLTATRMIPNYDPRKEVSDLAISQAWIEWDSYPHDLNDASLWMKAMGSAGGRPDIGPFPTWVVRWLYTGDYRIYEKTFTMADLAGAWPMCYREANPAKHIDRAGTVSGLGHIMSISERPSFFGRYLDYYYSAAEDRVTTVGPYTTDGWNPDNCHQPDPYYALYLLTGEYWYLEQMYFWTTWGAGWCNGAATLNSFWGRGPTGAEGGLYDEVRGEAWCFRTRAQTAAIAPDNSPEKDYFTQLVEDAIAVWEGARLITNTAYYSTPCWNWASTNGYSLHWGGLGPPALHQWHRGNEGLANTVELDTNVTREAIAPWMQNFMMYSLGRARELGFATDSLVEWLGEHIIGMIIHPDSDPYLIGTYREPTIRHSNTNYFSTYAQLKAGYTSGFDFKTRFESTLPDAQHGYAHICIPSIAACRHLPGGDSAWSFIVTNSLTNSVLENNPKWAILPAPDETRDTQPFQLSAFALTNQVVLRWPDPIACGLPDRTVHVRWSTNGYPSGVADENALVTTTNITHTHTNCTPGNTCYYTIWTSYDGITFCEPP